MISELESVMTLAYQNLDKIVKDHVEEKEKIRIKYEKKSIELINEKAVLSYKLKEITATLKEIDNMKKIEYKENDKNLKETQDNIEDHIRTMKMTKTELQKGTFYDEK